MRNTYIDYNATTPVDQKVIEEMLPYFHDDYGNPSSIHSFGNKAKAALDISREKVASVINVRPKELIFTNGGSESNNFLIKGLALSLTEKGNHIVSTMVEHASMLETLKYLETIGFEVTYLPVDSNGIIDLNELQDSITEKTVLISCIFANNETGVISPVNEIGRISRENGILFHTDSVQVLGKLKLDLSKIPVDAASFSSHKIYGPKGVGAAYLKSGLSPVSLIHGGGQEKGRRSGTENVPGVVGFGKACELIAETFAEENYRIGELTETLMKQITKNIKGVKLNGAGANRVPNTLNFSFNDVEGESLVMNLDLEGIASSTGSACSEGNVEPSHVLLAMGLTKKMAVSSLRLSLGRFTEEKDIEKIITVLPTIVERIRNTKI
ncbi:MAG: cysteine desulfurase family protein [Thermodesulfobacteriota bacterium]